MKKSLNPTRREGWRLWSSSWTLAICASWHLSLLRWSNCFVIVNIKRSEPPSPKDSAQLLWVILRANRSSAALFLFLIINAFDVLSSAKNGNVADFWWEKSRGGLRNERNCDTLLKIQKQSYFTLTSGERSAIILGRNKENVRYGRFSVDKRSTKSFIDSRWYTIWKLREKTPIGRFLQEGCFMSNT